MVDQSWRREMDKCKLKGMLVWYLSADELVLQLDYTVLIYSTIFFTIPSNPNLRNYDG